MENANAGPVTMDDVLGALDGADPLGTSASKIRAILGRGSFATLQKHLDALRAAAKAAQEPASLSAVPSAPPEVIAALWSAAYNAAGHQLAGKLASSMTERDALRAAAIAAADDVATLAAQVDALEQEAAAAHASSEAALADCAAARKELQAHQARDSANRMQLVTAAEADVMAARHALEMEKRDRTIERQTLQSTVNSLTDQIGELKALLSLQARQHIAQAVQP